jgi:hypothetical protein
VPWRLIQRFFDVHLHHMRYLVRWLIEKGASNTLLVTSKLRSRKATHIIKKEPRRKLSQAMLEYLQRKETLRAWQGRSLEERAALLNQRYPPL